jgi:hypothetical protein
MKLLSPVMVGIALLVGLPVHAADSDVVAKGVSTAANLIQNGVQSGPMVASVIPEPSDYGFMIALAVAGVIAWRRFSRASQTV